MGGHPSKAPVAQADGHRPVWRRALPIATGVGAAGLLYLTWYPIPLTGLPAPDWSGLADVTAPLTRKLVFYHPALSWAALLAYAFVLAASIAYLNERQLRFDRAARAAAEVGLLMNSLALVTGTLWGIQEWRRSGQAALATVYTDPKVMVFVVLWLTFVAYMLLRRLVDGTERRARLAAVVGIVGFLGVPLSWATSRVFATSQHPDLAGPGSDPEAAVATSVGVVIVWSLVVFALLFLQLFLARRDLLEREAQIEAGEAAHAE
jgi:heme exporter protein C